MGFYDDQDFIEYWEETQLAKEQRMEDEIENILIREHEETLKT